MPSGVFAPVLSPPCSLHRPLGIPGHWQGVPRRFFAPHRGAFEKSPVGLPFLSHPCRFSRGDSVISSTLPLFLAIALPRFGLGASPAGFRRSLPQVRLLESKPIDDSQMPVTEFGGPVLAMPLEPKGENYVIIVGRTRPKADRILIALSVTSQPMARLCHCVH
jgi:hypothetical protein